MAKTPTAIIIKNLGISYPEHKDKMKARKLGRPPGGDIKIHGLPNGREYIGSAHILSDWTEGCIAVSNKEIDELFEHVGGRHAN